MYFSLENVSYKIYSETKQWAPHSWTHKKIYFNIAMFCYTIICLCNLWYTWLHKKLVSHLFLDVLENGSIIQSSTHQQVVDYFSTLKFYKAETTQKIITCNCWFVSIQVTFLWCLRAATLKVLNGTAIQFQNQAIIQSPHNSIDLLLLEEKTYRSKTGNVFILNLSMANWRC